MTTEPDGPVVSTPAEPRDRGICGAHTEPSGLLRAATCELLHGHAGWHRDGGMSWVDADEPAERERAAYERGKAEALPLCQLAYERGLREATEGQPDRAVLLRLVRELVDQDECWFDHHGGCQAHGYLWLEPGEQCPHAEAEALLARLVGPGEPAEQPKPARQQVCSCSRIEVSQFGRYGDAHHYVPGRPDPRCPFHGEPAHGGTVDTQEPAIHAEEAK